MKIINLSETDSILNQYVSEIRNVEVQNDRLRFRRNIERIGEVMAYEMSKTFAYSVKEIQTPLGIAPVRTPDNPLVISTILRAGLPFHQGFLSYFDYAENAFVSAYRKYKDTLKFDIHIEYIASPRIDGKTLMEVSRFVSEKLSTLEGVVGTTTHFILKKYKDHGTILKHEKKEERIPVML